MNRMDPTSRRAMIIMSIIGLVLTLGSLVFGRVEVTGGVVGGLTIALLDFWLIQRFVNNLLQVHQRGFFSPGYLIRFAAICGVLYLLVRVLDFDALAIAVGFSALVVATILSGLMAFDGSEEETPDPPEDAADLEASDG